MGKNTGESKGDKGTKWIKRRKKGGDSDDRMDKLKKFIVIKYIKK
jgi:hypothetical protein